MKTNVFLKYLRDYFTVYLPKQRICSPHTITACRQSWNMLLGFISEKYSVNLENISFEMLNRENITNFLDEMRLSKSWTASTYNQRLGCIRSFFKYAASADPIIVIYSSALSGIPPMKGSKTKIVNFMSQEAVKVFLRQPNYATRLGLRDSFFMSLMYDTAARDCEMLAMEFGDLDADRLTVYLNGKNSKMRQVPISPETAINFKYYAEAFHSEKDRSQFMFYTIRQNEKTSMSDDNVARFFKGYASTARKICEEVPERVTPHMLRHSRAMHLYRAGMPLALLSEWLGHENPETTLIYAYADTEMKRKAVEKANCNNISTPDAISKIWKGDDDMIRRLCGL